MTIRRAVRVHLTNVTGTGASQLAASLLPALERSEYAEVSRIDLPDRGMLSRYRPLRSHTRCTVYERRLPNALSRLIECTIAAPRFSGPEPLLILGDLPLRCKSPQTVFVQTPHALAAPSFAFSIDFLKYYIWRAIFRLNMNRAQAFIVQTPVMRDALADHYPELRDRIHVIAQPVPIWLLQSGIRRTHRIHKHSHLDLFYPAALYPHKNHVFLSKISARKAVEWPVSRLTLTIDDAANPARNIAWVSCVGPLSSQEMLTAYSSVDAILFLSRQESYGFPLVEAMYVGLPIICPDLPYARTLCGDTAIYFNPAKAESMLAAIEQLRTRLLDGWWPDWGEQLRQFPENWESVAERMIRITCGAELPTRF